MEHLRVGARCWTVLVYLRERVSSGIFSSPEMVLKASRVVNVWNIHMQLFEEFLFMSDEAFLSELSIIVILDGSYTSDFRRVHQRLANLPMR